METYEEKRKIFYLGIIILIIILVYLFYCYLGEIPDKNRVTDEYDEYECDVQVFNLNTKIVISKGDEEIATVSGDIFRLIEDPLTMYDSNNKKIGYAGDTYHFISQDSHGIYVDDKFSCDMVGLVEFSGESYEIYDKDEKLIAKMEFNALNTEGILYDSDDNLLAEYSSGYFYYDFDVKIYDNCTLDEKTVLMLFCSYYSDYSADNS